MNKTLLMLSLFLAFSFVACSDSDVDDTPVIDVWGIYLNDDDTDYSRNPELLPVLTRRDTLEIIMQLDGKGSELKSFNVSLVDDPDDEKSKLLKTILFFYYDDVSDELTDAANGLLFYVDGIMDSWVTAKLCIRTTVEEEIDMRFYLSSKAKSEAGTFDLSFRTGERIDPEPEQTGNPASAE